MLTGNDFIICRTGRRNWYKKGVHETANISCVRNLSIGHNEKTKNTIISAEQFFRFYLSLNE
jgi:hypothetical protein